MEEPFETFEFFEQAETPESETDEELESLFLDRLALTRLIVGAVEVGAEEFLRRVQTWNRESWQVPTRKWAQDADDDLWVVDGAGLLAAPAVADEPAAEDARAVVLRQLAVGMIFEVQDRLVRGLDYLSLVLGYVDRRTAEPIRWFGHRPVVRPVVRRLELLADRGAQEVTRWRTRGRAEETWSRAMANTAFTEIVDEVLHYMGDNPEVMKLVQTQSTGLATEVMEETRERTVSADTVVEGIVRSLLRRTPRNELPPPSPTVRQSAVIVPATRRPRKSP